MRLRRSGSLLVALGGAAPLVLCIDDLHWGDLDSAALISDPVNAPVPEQPLLICRTAASISRPVPVSERCDRQPRVQRLYLERRIDVDALTADDARAC